MIAHGFKIDITIPDSVNEIFFEEYNPAPRAGDGIQHPQKKCRKQLSMLQILNMSTKQTTSNVCEQPFNICRI